MYLQMDQLICFYVSVGGSKSFMGLHVSLYTMIMENSYSIIYNIEMEAERGRIEQ